MPSRPFGVMFGRIIFEFGIPVVPDLTTAVGNHHSPALSGTTASLERYYRLLIAVLPLDAHFHHIPANS